VIIQSLVRYILAVLVAVLTVIAFQWTDPIKVIAVGILSTCIVLAATRP
jgi:hypothetical protein